MIARKQDDIAFLAGRWPLDPQRPTLVFIHGSGQQGSFWQAQVDGLTGVANTLAIDLPGHGDSRGDGFDSVPDYARAVLGLIEVLDAPAPVVCGLSLGGAIALQLMMDHGERLKAGILVNTGARLKVLPVIIETIERDYDAHLNALIDFAVAPANRTDDAICRQVLASYTAGPTVTANDFRACDAFDVMQRVASIDLPVLVMSADQDILTPPKYADWMAAHIRGARQASIGGAGHMAPIEHPGTVNDAMAQFIEAVC
jgi:pimeloyl-ACP methyl ester carboxylesterase